MEDERGAIEDRSQKKGAESISNLKDLARVLENCQFQNEEVVLEGKSEGAIFGLGCELIPQAPFIRVQFTWRGRTRTLTARRSPKR